MLGLFTFLNLWIYMSYRLSTYHSHQSINQKLTEDDNKEELDEVMQHS